MPDLKRRERRFSCIKWQVLLPASLLNLFFAPIGSLYCHGWPGAVFLVILYVVVANVWGSDKIFYVWLCGPIWALMAFFQCKAYNKQLLEEDFRKKLNDKKEG